MTAPSKSYSDMQILLFIVGLCTLCGFLLAVIAYSLQTPQTKAKVFDQSKQMLIAAKILSHEGYFTLLQKDGSLKRARYDTQKDALIADPNAENATPDQIKALADARIRPLFTNDKGDIFTPEEKKIDLPEYLEKNKKAGYAVQPFKLFYAVLPNDAEKAEKVDLSKLYAVVIPISGFGLWAPIYGYLALEPNGDTVIGTTWYDQAETPGLGANIAQPNWQKQFYGKEIFHEEADGSTDYKTAPLGIIVVKGTVQDVYGDKPIGNSAVDGMSGATLTGDGVTAAYRDSLTPYRPLFIKLAKEKSDG